MNSYDSILDSEMGSQISIIISDDPAKKDHYSMVNQCWWPISGHQLDMRSAPTAGPHNGLIFCEASGCPEKLRLAAAKASFLRAGTPNYMATSLQMHTRTHTHTHTHICMYVHMLCKCIYIYICVCVWIDIDYNEYTCICCNISL